MSITSQRWTIGFTLVEFLIILGVVAIIATLALPYYKASTFSQPNAATEGIQDMSAVAKR